MAVGDLNGDGKPDLITADWDAGKVTVSLGVGDGSFAAGVDYAAGDHPTSIILSDLDGDGRFDLIAANASAGTVSVLLGVGNGQFKQLQAYKLGLNSSLLAIGDFSDSGRADLIAVDAASSRFAFLLNDGKGGFSEPALHALGKTPVAITVADLNHDGHPDLAFANSDGSISILWGSKGGFQAGPVVSAAQGALSAILAGDFNHDGILDLAVTIPGSKQLAILVGNGDGSFAAPARYSVGANPVAIISADMDEDGIADLIVTNQGSNTFSMLGGNSDGSFRTALDFVSGRGPTTAVAGDFNNDGHLDLAVLNHDAQSLSLPLGNGDGTFLAARAYGVEMQPRSVAAGDLAGNKRSDLVVTNFCGSDAACTKDGSVSVLIAGESNSYHFASNYALGTDPVAVALLDVDGDKNFDIVALNRADKTISVLLGLGGGSFQQQYTLPLANAPITFAAGDFNHDGKTDLAVIGDCGAAKCTQPGTLEILYGSGDGGFQAGPSYPVGFEPSSVAASDLNSDKNLDVVVANNCGNSAACTGAGTASVFLGDANGRFAAAQTLGLVKSPSSIVLADLSGRGTPDLLVSSSSDNTLARLRGNGDGSFGAATVYAVGTTPGSIAVADFNGDGKLDVAVGNVADSTISILYGKGDGTLFAGSVTSVGPGPSALATLQSGAGNRVGLVTANAGISASTSAAMAGSDITVLSNIHPADDPTGTTVTTTVLTPAPNPASTTVNQSVTLSATVTGTAEGGPPTGTVTFSSSPNALTDCTPTSTPGTISTVWTCTTQSLQAPSQSITAVYSGDATYAGSTSAAVVETVASESANFVFDSFSPSPATVDEAVTLISKVVVSSGKITPQGTVKFTVNGTIACNSVPITVQSGVAGANCVTQALLASIPTNTVSATYSGDKNFSIPNLTDSGGASINQVTLTIAAQSSAPTASVNQPVTFSAALTLPAGGVPSPTQATGTVTFAQGSTTLCTAAVNPSLATAICSPVTFSAATVPAGVTISATYSGDGNFSNKSAAGTTTQIVKADPITIVAGPTAASAINQLVTFNATVTPTYPSSTAAPLAGKVSFTDTTTNTPMCSSVALAAGSASCPYKFPSAGPQTVTIAFTPTDSTQFAPGSTTATQQVNASDVSLTLTANPATLSVNEKTTLTTTISSQSGSGTLPDGTVTITDGSPTNVVCQNLTITGGVVQTCPATFGSPGNHTLTATYTPGKSGDFNPATFMLPLTITPDGTSTALGLAQSSANPSVVNQSVSIIATVTPASTGAAAMSGTVTFTDTPPVGTPISLCTAVPVATVTSGSTITSATATCPAAFVSVGKHSVTASYTSGNTNYGSSTASAITQTVNADMTSSATSSSFSAAATVNATMQITTTITPVNLGVAPPTGTVQVTAQNTATKANSTLCNSVPVTAAGTAMMATGTAVCSYAALPAASYSISSSYTNTDGNFTGSSSSATQTITPAPTSVVVTSSSPTPIATQTVTLIATVTPTPRGSIAIVPGGTVSFSATGDAAVASTMAASCTKVPVAASTSGTVIANCPVAFSSSDNGPVTVQAVYNPDSNFVGSTSGPPATQPFTIQDFSLSSSTSSLFVAQGYSNTTNPFANAAPFSSQPLNVGRNLIGGFSDPLSLSCAVHSVSVDAASVSGSASPTVPTCHLSTTSLNADDQSTPVMLTVTSAATDAVGQYAVTVTVNDTSIQTLSHAITVNVVVAQVEGTLSIGSGSSGSADLLFATPIIPASGTPPTLVSVSCNSILSQTPGNSVSGIACTAGSATSIIPATTTSNGLIQVPITIVAGTPSASAGGAVSNAIHIAALWAMPLVAFAIWLFGGRPLRKSYLRFFLLLSMAAGLLGGVGCGGSFSGPPQAKGTASGYYTIQVVADYSDGSSYAAVVNIFVAASE